MRKKSYYNERNDFMNDNVKEILEWALCIIVAVALALIIRYFIGTPTEVRQSSMWPTLQEGQRLILNKLPKTFGEIPQRGDIITFERPSNSTATMTKASYNNEPTNIFTKFSYYVLEIGKESFIKRAIGLPGERVKIENGKVYINGEELEEPYLQEGVSTYSKNEYLTNFIVPEGYIFAMGDNREGSRDCRDFGCIPIEKVEGKVWIRVWPFDLFGEIK